MESSSNLEVSWHYLHFLWLQLTTQSRRFSPIWEMYIKQQNKEWLSNSSWIEKCYKTKKFQEPSHGKSLDFLLGVWIHKVKEEKIIFVQKYQDTKGNKKHLTTHTFGFFSCSDVLSPKRSSPGRARADLKPSPSPGPSNKFKPEPWRASTFYFINNQIF